MCSQINSTSTCSESFSHSSLYHLDNKFVFLLLLNSKVNTQSQQCVKFYEHKPVVPLLRRIALHSLTLWCLFASYNNKTISFTIYINTLCKNWEQHMAGSKSVNIIYFVSYLHYSRIQCEVANFSGKTFEYEENLFMFRFLSTLRHTVTDLYFEDKC